MNDEFHISSFIVQAKPEQLTSLQQQLKAIAGVDVHQTSPAGKIIITLECNNTHDITQATTAIGKLPGVLSCNMVFHQIENDPHNNASNQPLTH
jgi:nitrate reductase NapD